MTNPVPIIRVPHLFHCECYKCEVKRENNLKLPDGKTKAVLEVVLEEEDELTPLAIQTLKHMPKTRGNIE